VEQVEQVERVEHGAGGAGGARSRWSRWSRWSTEQVEHGAGGGPSRWSARAVFTAVEETKGPLERRQVEGGTGGAGGALAQCSQLQRKRKAPLNTGRRSTEQVKHGAGGGRSRWSARAVFTAVEETKGAPIQLIGSRFSMADRLDTRRV
jgi:hypothetical protein